MGFFDIFRKPTKRELKKKQIRNNAEQGKSGEEKVVFRYRMNGWKMKRSGIGHDYIASKRNPQTGKMEYLYVEIKTGNAKLSPLQEEAKKKYGSRYVVERVQVNPFIGFQDSNIVESRTPVGFTSKKNTSSKLCVFGISKTETTKKRTTKKQQKSILKSIFGTSNTTQKKTIKKPTSFSNADSLWGNSSTKTKRKKTTKKTIKKPTSFSNADSLWGNSSTKTKRKKTRKKSSNNLSWLGGSTKSSKNKSNVDKIWGSSSKNTSIW